MLNENIIKQDLTKLEENLGRMIKKGFDGVDEKFKENTEEHQQIFKGFEKIDEKFEHIEARLDMVEGDLFEIKDKIISKEEKEDLINRIELLEQKAGVAS